MFVFAGFWRMLLYIEREWCPLSNKKVPWLFECLVPVIPESHLHSFPCHNLVIPPFSYVRHPQKLSRNSPFCRSTKDWALNSTGHFGQMRCGCEGCVLVKPTDRGEVNHWGRWLASDFWGCSFCVVCICTGGRWDCQHGWFFRIHISKAAISILPNEACVSYQHLMTKAELFWLSSAWSTGLFFIPLFCPLGCFLRHLDVI